MVINNEFFKRPIEGVSQELPIACAVEIACNGGRVFFSKRLAPPLTICNARVYADDDFVFSSDIEIIKVARALALISKLYGVTIRILYEHGNSVYWTSEDPETWQPSGKNLREAYAEDEPRRKELQRQWMIDHGVARRTPLEWFRDFKTRWRYRVYDWKYRWKNRVKK